jgi:hypothetical protein
MSVTVASAAAFLTPVATPVNLMVMGPAATALETTGNSAAAAAVLCGRGVPRPRVLGFESGNRCQRGTNPITI